MIFLDASVLHRRFAGRRAPGLAVARAGGRLPCISEISRVEFPSGIHRRVREGTLAPGPAREAIARFEAEAIRCLRVPLDEGVLRRAAALVAVHPLRSLDALQLAGALALADGAPAAIRFATADARLAAAARAEGLEVAEG